jgi:hypothetical protein
MKKLYRFLWDCGRMGYVEGVFIADDAEVNEAIGKEIYFGEILGKHSEIHGTLDAHDLTVLSEEADFITKIEGVFGSSRISGHCPLDYFPESEEED